MPYFHIAAGTIALICGYLALFAKKGGKLHALSGNAYVIAMVLMSFSGSVLTLLDLRMLTLLNALFTLYLVITGWIAVKRRSGQAHQADIWLMVMAFLLCCAQFYFGYLALTSAAGNYDGFSAMLYFAFGSVVAVALLLDVRLVVARGIRGSARLIRHLWRMCFALFIAAASFFLGQQQVFPDVLRQGYLLVIPVILVLFMLVYYLIKLGLGRWLKQRLLVPAMMNRGRQ